MQIVLFASALLRSPLFVAVPTLNHLAAILIKSDLAQGGLIHRIVDVHGNG